MSVNEKPPKTSDAERLQRVYDTYMELRPRLCMCSWNPDGHAEDCPVTILDRVIRFPK